MYHPARVLVKRSMIAVQCLRGRDMHGVRAVASPTCWPRVRAQNWIPLVFMKSFCRFEPVYKGTGGVGGVNGWIG